MSDTLFSFIPTNPEIELSAEQIISLELLDFKDAEVEINSSEKIMFADAGENFESVSCPFCGATLSEWWSKAMDAAYSDTIGFVCLAIVTPCCHKDSSLNDLKYDWPQGFYKSMVLINPSWETPFDSEMVLYEIERVTGITWRLVIARI